MQFSTGQTTAQRLQPTHSLLDHLEMPFAVQRVGDGLVRGVLAGDMARPHEMQRSWLICAFTT